MYQLKQRRDFTDEFKNDAVKLVTEQGYSATEVGRRLGINYSNVSHWGREHRRRFESPTGTPNLEVAAKRFRKENKRLQVEPHYTDGSKRFLTNIGPAMVPAEW